MVATRPGGPAAVPGGWLDSVLHLAGLGLFTQGCWAGCSERAPPTHGEAGVKVATCISFVSQGLGQDMQGMETDF